MSIETTHFQTDSSEIGWHKKVQALFLLSDLEQFQDSFTIVLEGHFGYANQSQMNTMYLKNEKGVMFSFTLINLNPFIFSTGCLAINKYRETICLINRKLIKMSPIIYIVVNK